MAHGENHSTEYDRGFTAGRVAGYNEGILACQQLIADSLAVHSDVIDGIPKETQTPQQRHSTVNVPDKGSYVNNA